MNTQRKFQVLGVLALGVSLALAGCGGVSGRAPSAALPTTTDTTTVSGAPVAADNPDTFADLLAVGLTEASKAR